MVKILTIFLVGAVLFVLLLRIFFVQCIGKESESPLPTKMSSPGRMIVKSITGNGVPASPSVAGSASGAVTVVCGNGANVGRYETRPTVCRIGWRGVFNMLPMWKCCQSPIGNWQMELDTGNNGNISPARFPPSSATCYFSSPPSGSRCAHVEPKYDIMSLVNEKSDMHA